MKVKLLIEYDGTNFFGWQKQPNKRTVQGEIEDALYNLIGERVHLLGSGRTDAGTHAEGQVAHFQTEKTAIPPERYSYALNVLLPSDVKIQQSVLEADNFHAIASAKSKTYQYKMYKSDIESPLKERFYTRINESVSVDKMKELAPVFVGTHDFKCVLASGSSVKDTVRTVYSLEIFEKGNQVILEICGNGFLYNMVRIICGTLVAYGEQKITKQEVLNAFMLGDRTKLKKTMPAKGLTLVKVDY